MIPFCKVEFSDAEIEAVVNVVRSGWIGKGPVVDAFERELAAYLGVDPTCVVTLNACTSAMFLALKHFGIGPGDEVITTPLTFCATAHVIEHCGARAVFADVDPVTWNLSLAAVSEAITPWTRVLLPVDLYGLPCDVAGFAVLAGEYDLVVLEDAAHALGAYVGGRKIGTLGSQMTTFSLYPTKNVASPDGGVLVANRDIASDVRLLSGYGLSSDAWGRMFEVGYAEPLTVGLGYKMYWNDMAAALALAQLRGYPQRLKRRLIIAWRFREVLSSFDVELQPDVPGHVWHLLSFKLGDCFPENVIVVRQLRSAGLGAAVKYPPLHLHPYYQAKYGYDIGDFPVAEELGRRLVTISPSPAMTDDEVDAACKILVKVLGRY